ncbi:FAD-dependent oxidoreductase [Xylophilus sp.]|uniref:FAD-dependent oxidoreductase n=1 Tax=Xylophilus sp. TaxID=2653893 RepID=UPI0013BB4F83|nr:FAD-dependent oxidoreductase [Xylophilus sp.]KAF1050124.1 MAG: 8-methylmenaquinol:fumarate reductase flavoprotein subunit [Xylophilus sp.]
MSTPWDVIVVGAGAAGLVAAWHARQQGASVLVVNKGLVGRSGATITSGGGISAAGSTLRALGLDVDATDTEETFFHDTVRAGSFLNDQRLVEAMVTGVGDELRRYIAAGVKFRVNKKAPGHSSGRGIHISGPDMQKAVTDDALAAGVQFREDFQSTALLTRDGAVVGVAGLDRRTGEAEALHGHAVVIATGGTTSNWHLRTAPEELSGEGHAMALDAGASLIEMELLQFLPCCLAAPPIWRGLQFPWILGPQGGLRAWLLNRYGERFMARWDPERMELATRDVVSAACAAEVVEGRGSPSGAVYLSWKHLPDDILDHYPTWSKSVTPDWHWQGFDMKPLIERIRADHAVEVMPAAHFSLGGIRVDGHGGTGVPGLFAAGEATGAVHGANRLSGNAGAQVLVQGKRAGVAAARDARERRADGRADNLEQAFDAIHAPWRNAGRDGVVPYELKDRLTQLAESTLGAARSGPALEAALARLQALARDELPRLAPRDTARVWNRDWSDALEVRAAVPVLESALRGALGRPASIGAHQRHDLRGVASQGTLRHSIVRRSSDGDLSLTHEAVRHDLLQPA